MIATHRARNLLSPDKSPGRTAGILKMAPKEFQAEAKGDGFSSVFTEVIPVATSGTTNSTPVR